MAVYVYRYNPQNSEYIGRTPAILDPLESKRQGTEVFACPANATFEQVPDELAQAIKPNQTIIRDGSQWALADDYRGQQHYTETGQLETITEIGIKPNGYPVPPAEMLHPLWDPEAVDWAEIATAEELEADLEKAKKKKSAEVAAARAQELGQGVTTTIDGGQGPITLQASEESDVPRWMMAIMEWVLEVLPEMMAKADPAWFAEKMAETTIIRDADDQVVEISMADFLQAMGLVGGKLRATLAKQWKLKDQAKNAAEKKDLDAVTW